MVFGESIPDARSCVAPRDSQRFILAVFVIIGERRVQRLDRNTRGQLKNLSELVRSRNRSDFEQGFLVVSDLGGFCCKLRVRRYRHNSGRATECGSREPGVSRCVRKTAPLGTATFNLAKLAMFILFRYPLHHRFGLVQRAELGSVEVL